jgi:hypothetical protein
MTKSLIPATWGFHPPGKLRLIDVRSAADLALHADAWGELLLQSPAASPMLSYPQISAFFETQVPDLETWLCLFAYDDERLVGVFPLIAAKVVGILGFAVLFLKTPYSVLHTSGVDCLTLHGREEVIEVFAAYLSRIPRTWALVRMRELPDVSPTMVYLKRGGGRVHAVHWLGSSENYIEVPESYEAYHAGFSSNFKRQLKRGARKLEQVEDVRFFCRDDRRTASDNVMRFEQIESSGWKGEQEFTIKAVEGSARFYTLAAERFHRYGWMEWNFLESGDRTIGAHYGVRIKRTLFLLKISYDNEFSACSPGNLLLEKVVQHACETRELDEINCVADCAWHKNWNMKSRQLHDLILLPGIPLISAFVSFIFNSEPCHQFRKRLNTKQKEVDSSSPKLSIP